MTRNSISQTKRQIIFARDNWSCIYCGKHATLSIRKLSRPMRSVIDLRDESGRQFQVDHIIPVAKSGDNSFNNLGTTCHSCNNKKSDKIIKPKYHFFRVDFK
jgi:5-methylcytosine-specific restriction endonuclease McrA